MLKRVVIVTLWLGILLFPGGKLCAQNFIKRLITRNPNSVPRLERKAVKYEDNIKKIRHQGAEMLKKDKVNYAKLDKLKRKLKKLSLKAEKCRYKLKTKRHIKLQERAVKRRMKKSLKHHRKYKMNKRHKS